MFTSPSAVPNGDSFLFSLFAASLPDTGSGGFENQYEASRTAADWIVSRRSPSALEALGPHGGGYSSNQDYGIFLIEGFRGGTLSFCDTCQIVYVRYPDGSFHLLGEGTVPTGSDTDGHQNGFVDDPLVSPRWLTPDGSHQIFESRIQLKAEAPAAELFEVYDRTPAGLKLISLLPGDVPPEGESVFAGTSADGSTVLFINSGSLYARVDNERTILIASGSAGEVLPGGVNGDGSRVFFVQAGNVFVYDVGTEEASVVADPGNAVLVNVSPDGSHAYFTSETVLVPGEGTPSGQNLYVWDGTSIAYVATLVPSDLVRSENPFVGLALWTQGYNRRPAAENAHRSLNTGRTTPDGRIFVFESSAQLTLYPNEGHIEIYRYDSVAPDLSCVSCSPTNPSAAADSELVFTQEDGAPKINAMLDVPNLSSDGDQVVFESLDSLLPRDVNGVRDVYEWRAGTLSLISTGGSSQPSGLMGVTPSGNDIFFETGESLLAQGQEPGALAIYDARVEGGLASQHAQTPLGCLGEGCLGQSSGAPDLAVPASSRLSGQGNVKHRCARTRHRHRRHRGQRRHQGPKRICVHSRRGAGK